MEYQKEMDCVADSIIYGLQELAKGEHYAAAFHLENAARSLREIERIKEEEANGKVFLVGNVCNGRNPFD